jgi:hypothetical protein
MGPFIKDRHCVKTVVAQDEIIDPRQEQGQPI